MPITIELESTGDLVTVDGHRARIWRGRYRGAPVVAFISSIAVLDSEACIPFAKELGETPEPTIQNGEGLPFDDWKFAR